MSGLVKFCAKCGSLNVKPVYFTDSIDNRIQCVECGSIGLPVEGDEKFRKKVLERVLRGRRKW